MFVRVFLSPDHPGTKTTWGEFTRQHGNPLLLAYCNDDGVSSDAVIFTFDDHLFWRVSGSCDGGPVIELISEEEAKELFYECASSSWSAYPTDSSQYVMLEQWIESEHDPDKLAMITRPLEEGEWA